MVCRFFLQGPIAARFFSTDALCSALSRQLLVPLDEKVFHDNKNPAAMKEQDTIRMYSTPTIPGTFHKNLFFAAFSS
jgi:hypothetical protein